MGVFFWILFAIAVLVLGVLLFPFIFRIEFEASETLAYFKLFLYKKQLYIAEKHFSKNKNTEDVLDEFKDEPLDDEPDYVPTQTKKVDAKKENVENTKIETTSPKEEIKSQTSKKTTEIQKTTATESIKKTPQKIENDIAPENSNVPPDEIPEEKKELTEREMWSILLTSDYDEKALKYIKRALKRFVKIFELRFENCFVEGIRMTPEHMGYGAAFNGYLKGFPFFENWELRMDWERNKKLLCAGKLFGTVNLCRVLAFLFETSFYALILYFMYRKRKTHFLKTGTLPELGFIRQKILNFIVDD